MSKRADRIAGIFTWRPSCRLLAVRTPSNGIRAPRLGSPTLPRVFLARSKMFDISGNDVNDEYLYGLPPHRGNDAEKSRETS